MRCWRIIENKNIIIVVLIIVIIILTIFFIRYCKEVNYVTNHSIYTNLKTTDYVLENMSTKLSNSQDIDQKEFKNMFKDVRPCLVMNAANTKKYKCLSKRYKYVDIDEFALYLQTLLDSEMSEVEFKYHKENMQKICNLWANTTISFNDNFLNPSSKLREILTETNTLSEEGYERL